MKFDVFGRTVLVVGKDEGWTVYYLGSEGKRRLASDIIVPSDVTEDGMAQYLDDLCHEWATERNNSVKRLD